MVTEKEKRRAEEEYFARLEFERRQKKLQEEHSKIKEQEREQLQAAHWMRCPKCGMEMLEVDFEGIRVDRCSSCLGIYLDHGEVEQMIQKTAPGFLRRMADIFK